MLNILLRNRIMLAMYSLRNYRNTRARGILFRFIVLLIIPYWIYSITSDLFAAWHAVPGFNISVIIHFITLLLSGLLVMLILSGVPQALHFNFLAPDNLLLSALPLEKAILQKYRFWEIYFSNSAVFFLFGLPVIVAALVILKIALPGAALLVCGVLLFLVIPTGLSSLISILLARFLPVKRTKHLSSIIMGVMIIGLWAFLQFFRLSRLDPFSGNFDPSMFNSLVQSRDMYISRFLPSTWVALALQGFASHNTPVIIQNLLFLLAAAVILFQLTIRLSGRIDNIIHSRVNRAAIKVMGQRHTPPQTHFAKTVRPLHVIIAMVGKDMKLYFRDSRFVTQIFFYFSLFIVLPFLLREPFPVANETFASFAPFTCMMFATIFMAGGLTARGIPLERSAFNYSRIIPNADLVYLSAKFITGFLLTAAALIVGIIITAVLALTPVHIIVQVSALLLLNTLGAAAIGVLTGISFANFCWDNPRQMLTENGNIVLNILGMVYLAGGILFFVIGTQFSGKIIAPVLFSFYTLVCCTLGVLFALFKIRNMEGAR